MVPLALRQPNRGSTLSRRQGDRQMFSTRLTRVAAIASAAVLLAACGTGGSSYAPAGQQQGGAPAQDGPSTTAPSSAQSGEKVHLVYFNARGAEAAERALANRYMKDHPNVEIEYLSAT